MVVFLLYPYLTFVFAVFIFGPLTLTFILSYNFAIFLHGLSLVSAIKSRLSAMVLILMADFPVDP